MTITHRLSRSPTYKSWLKMKERCTNQNATQWKWYGGRGVGVCERWLASFEDFLADVGERPSLAHTLDRFPTTDGNYEPGNVRWASRQEQIDNQRKTIWVTIDGERMTLREVCRRRGLKFLRVYGRIKSGHSLEAALKPDDLRFKAEAAA